MGAVIAGTAVVWPRRSPFTYGARRLADHAIEACLRQANTRADALDLLVNAGVYRERGLGEPALAALIQQDVAANADGVAADHHGTFSFDVDNAACGALTGADIVRGFLSSDAIDTGMVVASDSGPDPLHARAFPRLQSGSAMLLTRDDTVDGLSKVRLSTYPEFAGLSEGYWQWSPRGGVRRNGANRLVVLERPGFAARATECAADTVADLLRDEQVSVRDIDLMVATPEAAVADSLADLIGIPAARTLHSGERIGAMHTAQFVAAVDQARRSGRWTAARTILLVSAGSGLSIAAAIYRQ